MIKANELRIGNLLSWIDDNEIVKVKGFYITNTIWVEYNYNENETDEIDCQLECLKPIPLTEEWLVKFGFEKDKAHNCYVLYEHDTIDLDLEFSCTLKNVTIGGFCTADEMKNCKYVHQLQNLYFALTGEELELKPETT